MKSAVVELTINKGGQGDTRRNQLVSIFDIRFRTNPPRVWLEDEPAHYQHVGILRLRDGRLRSVG